MKYVCMARSGFLPEFNINAKHVYFNPRFFPTTGSMIYWQVKDDGFHIRPNWRILRSSDDGFHIQPNWRMLRSSDQGRVGRNLTMTGSCASIEGGSGPERPQGRVFCLLQLFPVTLTVKLILKGWGLGRAHLVCCASTQKHWISSLPYLRQINTLIFKHLRRV